MSQTTVPRPHPWPACSRLLAGPEAADGPSLPFLCGVGGLPSVQNLGLESNFHSPFFCATGMPRMCFCSHFRFLSLRISLSAVTEPRAAAWSAVQQKAAGLTTGRWWAEAVSAAASLPRAPPPWTRSLGGFLAVEVSAFSFHQSPSNHSQR